MDSDPNAPLCYDCKYRAAVTDSAFSACTHRTVTGRTALVKFTVPAGEYERWEFPRSYDPIWLDACGSFEQV
jgi:hypothetical protein